MTPNTRGRRQFTANLAMATAAAGMTIAGEQQVHASNDVRPEHDSPEYFASLVGQTFLFRDGTETFRAVLSEVQEPQRLGARPNTPGIRQRPYSLIFQPEDGQKKKEADYVVEHRQTGGMRMSLRPVEAGSLLESVIA